MISKQVSGYVLNIQYIEYVNDRNETINIPIIENVSINRVNITRFMSSIGKARTMDYAKKWFNKILAKKYNEEEIQARTFQSIIKQSTDFDLRGTYVDKDVFLEIVKHEIPKLNISSIKFTDNAVVNSSAKLKYLQDFYNTDKIKELRYCNSKDNINNDIFDSFYNLNEKYISLVYYNVLNKIIVIDLVDDEIEPDDLIPFVETLIDNKFKIHCLVSKNIQWLRDYEIPMILM